MQWSHNKLNGVMYHSNLLLKYALWTGTVGAHLVRRCVLYSYHFLDFLIRWIATRNGWNFRQSTWLKPNDVKSLQSWASQMRRASRRWSGSTKSVKAPFEKFWKRCELKKNHLSMTKSNLSRHLPNLKVLPTSKTLKLYTTLSSTSTTNCFAPPMFKRKLDRCMMNRDNHLRHFNKTLINCRWMSSVKNSCIHDKWLCMTRSNNKVWTLTLAKRIAHTTGTHT